MKSGLWQRILTGRAVVLGAVLLVLGALSAGSFATGADRAATWRWVLVPTDGPSFADIRTITHALETVRRGGDPYVDTSGDPWGRRFNYPRPLLWLAGLGLGPRQTDAIGIALALGFAGACLWLFAPTRILTGACLGAALVSPPVLLGIERGNIDLLVFAVLSAGFLGTAGLPGTTATLLRSGLVIAVAQVKIFPGAAALSHVADRRGVRVALLNAALAAGLFLTFARAGDLAAIGAATPQAAAHSFGCASLAYALTGNVAAGGDVRLARLASQVVALAVLLAVAVRAWRNPALVDALLPRLRPGDPRDDLALACLSIHVLVFLLGSNFDYRLVFLLGLLPPLLLAVEAGDARRIWMPPLAVVAYLWLSRLSAQVFFLDELLGWVVFAGAVAWLASTLRRRLLPPPAAIHAACPSS